MSRLKDFVDEYVRKEDISQNELARRMSIAKSTLSKTLNGTNKPTLYFLNKLARATGADFKALNDLSSDMPIKVNVDKAIAQFSRLSDVQLSKMEFLLALPDETLSALLDRVIADFVVQQQRNKKH